MTMHSDRSEMSQQRAKSDRDVETFILRTEGGPHPGDRLFHESDLSWPAPGFLVDNGGKYIKISESDLGPQDANGHCLRSVLYRWEPDFVSGVTG